MPARPLLALAALATTLLSASQVLACGGDPAPSGKDMVVTGGKGKEESALDAEGKEASPAEEHVENNADFDRFAFSCCKEESAATLVQAYVDLAEKLAADDEAGTQAAVAALHAAAAAAATAEGLDDAGKQQAQVIATGLEPLQGKSIAEVREPLASLSVVVIGFARDQQGGETKVVSAFCPMAPGHWLQRSQPIRNPYYGSEMLACGTLEAVTDVE